MAKKRRKRAVACWCPLLGRCEFVPSARPKTRILPLEPIDDLPRPVGNDLPAQEWLDHLDRLAERAASGVEVVSID